MNYALRFKRLIHQISGLASLFLLTACGESGQQIPSAQDVAKPAKPVSTPIAEVVRYYAGLMVHHTHFAKFSRSPFGNSVLVVAADSVSFTLSLPNGFIKGWLDNSHHLESLTINAPDLPLKPGQPLDLSHAPAGRLVRLGELRRAFGPGKVEEPMLTEQVATSLFAVSFQYRPANANRPVAIEANMHVPSYADTTKVAFISISSLQ
jgi:hypothetical protein